MQQFKEVLALFLGFGGWILAYVSLENRYWKESTQGGSVILTSGVYENLWMSCATDSMGVYDCWNFPSLFVLPGLCTMIAVSWYAANIIRQFFDQLYEGTKYEIGQGLYIGWSSALLALCAGSCLLRACKQNSSDKKSAYPYQTASRGHVLSTVATSQSAPGNYGRCAYV
ncbi:hypothetical protein GOODEAATRI_025449 [Goodea atripinnis]|uniref:Claudin n=1 Tax=Goodea atripinnis TaxID=208336 RepID=A0ABV0MNN4_9TELE